MDDNFDDIFGNNDSIGSAADVDVDVGGIAIGDGLKNDLAGNDGAIEDVDVLLSTDFDDIFETFDDADKKDAASNIDMSEMDKLLEVEKLKVSESGEGKTTSIYDDLSEALAEADSFVEEAKNTSVETSNVNYSNDNVGDFRLPATPSLEKTSKLASTPSTPLSTTGKDKTAEVGDNSPGGKTWNSMKSEDKDEFLTWLDADDADDADDAGGDDSDVAKRKINGGENLSVNTSNPEVDDTVLNAMRAIEKAAANSADESYLDVLRRSTSPRRSLSTDDSIALVAKVEEELTKPQPNLQSIRDMCRDFGGVPVSVRHQVWPLLLGVPSKGSQGISLEIAMHDSTVENLPNHDLLVKEATKSAQWATGKDPCASVGDDESKMYQEVARNVEKILTFYVRRRGLRNIHGGPVEYVCGLADVVTPFYASCARAGVTKPEQAVIFKCLYALCTAFMPTAHALSTARNPWEYLACHQFRVLLKYHDPEIEIHFTKLYENWADPFEGLFDSACLFKGYAGLLSCSGLLHLWDYLLVEADPNFCYFLTVALIIFNRKVFLSCTSRELLQEEARKLYKIIDTSDGLNDIIRSATKLDANTPKSFRKKMRHIFTTMTSSKPKASSSIDWYKKFWDFYMVFNPEKLEDAIALLPKFPGQESKVARRCEEKYDAPMTGFHLELKRPFLTVTAEEIVPQVIERSKRFLRYFVIDCRPSNEIAGGKFGQAWVLSLEQIRNPKKKEETLESLLGVKDQAHIVIMGSGTDKLLEEISVKEACKYALHDLETVNEVAKFFVDSGFPFISIVEGGFMSCYRVMEEKYTLQEFVDLSPRKCRPLRYDNYVKLKESNPEGAKLLKDHAIFALSNKLKKEEELRNKACVNGDPEVEAALAMAMESAKTGQSLRDRRNKIAMEKTLSSFKEKAGWLNRSVSAGVNSMKSAIDATIKNSMAQSNKNMDSDNFREAGNGSGEGQHLVDVPAFHAFSIGGDDDDDEDYASTNASIEASQDDAFDVARNFVGGETSNVFSANVRRNMPVKDSYSCVVPLISLVNGDILQRTLFEEISSLYGTDKNAYKCSSVDDTKTECETFLLKDRFVVVETFLRDRNTGLIVPGKRRLSGTYTNLQLQAKLASAKATEQAKIAAEKARRTSKELGRKFSSWFKNSTSKTLSESSSIDERNDSKDEGTEVPEAVVEEKTRHESCLRIIWNRHLSGLRRMTIKKGDSSVVTLYFTDDKTIVLKFRDREGFTKGLKLSLKRMKESPVE